MKGIVSVAKVIGIFVCECVLVKDCALVPRVALNFDMTDTGTGSMTEKDLVEELEEVATDSE